MISLSPLDFGWCKGESYSQYMCRQVLRWEDSHYGSNKENKQRNSYDCVSDSFSSSERYYGIEMFALTGPGWFLHYIESARVRGECRLNVIEYRKDIYKMFPSTEEKLKDLEKKAKMNLNVKFYCGDAFVVLPELLKNVRRDKILFDYDGTETLSKLLENQNARKGFLKIAKSLKENTKIEKMWLITTFCSRSEQLISPEEIDPTLQKYFSGIFKFCSVKPAYNREVRSTITTYSDTTPMHTSIWSINKV
jgi:hypothetical protein